MSAEEGGAALDRLSVYINAARQLTQEVRGRGLDPERADVLAGYLRAAQQLVRGGKLPLKSTPLPLSVQTGTRRFQLWQRSPLCIWCGRVTRINGVHQPDTATLDHLRRKKERARPSSIPATVLACRECNNNRGQPKAATSPACPIVERAA